MANSLYNDKKTIDDSLEQAHPYREFFKDDFAQSFIDGHHSIKGWVAQKADQFLGLLERTALEVAIGLILAGTPAIVYQYAVQNERNHSYKLNFSETTKIEDQARALGIAVPHMTDMLTKTNDDYMKHLESWNDSWFIPLLESNSETFPSELSNRIDITGKKHHYEIPQLTALIPALVDSVLKDLDYVRQMAGNVETAGDLAHKSWTHHHNDVTHEEPRTRTVYDSKGNSHEETYYVTVYDYTDNSYKYFKVYGDLTSGKLDSIKVWFPHISREGHFLAAKETGADNEYAMTKSRQRELKGKWLSPDEMLTLANSDLFGSITYHDMKALDEIREFLMQSGDKWRTQKNTSHSYNKRTYNHSHAECDEFLTTVDIVRNSNDFVAIADSMMNTVARVKQRVLALAHKDSVYLIAHSQMMPNDNIKESGKDITPEEIVEDAIKGYTELFPEGTHPDQADWMQVFYWGLGFGTSGAGIGYGVDRLAAKYNLYSRSRRLLRRKK